MPTWAVIGTIVVGLIGGGGLAGLFGTRLTNRTTRESAFIDDQADKIKSVEAEVADLKKRMSHVEAERRIDKDYIETLRLHISERREPPPPPYPPAVTGGA